MTNSSPSDSAMPLEEQLVAYLDGELDTEGSRRIEELLVADPEVRRRLQAMERTWELLDELDEAPPGDQFTHTTLEMVAVAARKEVEQTLAGAPRRRRRQRWLIGGGLLAAALAGFSCRYLLGHAVRSPTAAGPARAGGSGRLPADRQFRVSSSCSIKEKLFSGESDATPRGAPSKAEVPVGERRQLIERMSPSEKEDLRLLQDRFAALNPDRQQQLRRLHEELQHAPNAAAPPPDHAALL